MSNQLDLKRQKLMSENPFFGNEELFKLISVNTSTSNNVFLSILGSCWNNVKENNLFRACFHVINFNLGSVSRELNAHKKKGLVRPAIGEALNEKWLTYLTFLINNAPDDFIKLIPYIVEYVNLRDLITLKVKTTKKTTKIIGTTGLLKAIQENPRVYQAVLDHCSWIVSEGDRFQRWQLAKDIHAPRFSKRKRKSKNESKNGQYTPMQNQTIEVMKVKQKFINDLCEKVNWEIVKSEKGYLEYKGLKAWKRSYQDMLPDYLLSTKSILEMSETQFKNTLDTIPNGGHRRIKYAIQNSPEKWKHLVKWYQEYSEAKDKAQAKERELQVKVDMGLASDSDLKELEKVKKEAKVNVGATTLYDELMGVIKSGFKMDDQVIHSLLNKVDFRAKVFPVIDVSSSMSGFPSQLAALFATAVLLKCPGKIPMMANFSNRCDIFVDSVTIPTISTRFVNASNSQFKNVKIVDKTKPFSENYQNVMRILGNYGGGTNFEAFPDKLKEWTDKLTGAEKDGAIEEIQSMQVIMLISDGALNGGYDTPDSAMKGTIMKMRQYFGWNGVVVLWNIPNISVSNGPEFSRYKNIENFFEFNTLNAATITAIFSNLHDLDIIDNYVTIKAMFYNDRYRDIVSAIMGE